MKKMVVMALIILLFVQMRLISQNAVVKTYELNAVHLNQNSVFTPFLRPHSQDYHPMGFVVSIGSFAGEVNGYAWETTCIEAKTVLGNTLWRKYVSLSPDQTAEQHVHPVGITTVKPYDVFFGLNPNTSIVVTMFNYVNLEEPRNYIILQLDQNGDLVSGPNPSVEMYPYPQPAYLYGPTGIGYKGMTSAPVSVSAGSSSKTTFAVVANIDDNNGRHGITVHLAGSAAFQNYYETNPEYHLGASDSYYDYKCGRLYVCGQRKTGTAAQDMEGVVIAFDVDKITNTCTPRWMRRYSPAIDVGGECQLTCMHPIQSPSGDLTGLQLLGHVTVPDALWTLQVDVSNDCDVEVSPAIGSVINSFISTSVCPEIPNSETKYRPIGMTGLPGQSQRYVYSAIVEALNVNNNTYTSQGVVLGIMDAAGVILDKNRVNKMPYDSYFGDNLVSVYGENSHHAIVPNAVNNFSSLPVYAAFWDGKGSMWQCVDEDGMKSHCYDTVCVESIPFEVVMSSFAITAAQSVSMVPGLCFLYEPDEAVIEHCSTCEEEPALENKYHHGSVWSMGYSGALLGNLPATTLPTPLGQRRLVTGYVHGAPYSYEEPAYNYSYHSDVPIIVDNGSGVYNDFVRKGISTDVIGSGATEEERKSNSIVNNDIAYSVTAFSATKDVIFVGTKENKGMYLNSYMNAGVGDRNLLAVSVKYDDAGAENEYNAYTLNWAMEIGRRTTSTPNGVRSTIDYEKYTGKSVYSTIPVSSECIEEGRSVSVWPSITAASMVPPFGQLSLAPSILVAGFTNTSYAGAGCVSEAALNGLVAELDMTTGAVIGAFKHSYGGALGDTRYLTSDVLLDEGLFATTNSSGAVLAGYRRVRQPGQSMTAESAQNIDYGVITTVSRDLAVLVSKQLLFKDRAAPSYVPFTRYARIHDVAVIHNGSVKSDDQIIAVGTCFYAGAGGSPDVNHSFIVSFDQNLNVLWFSVFNIGNPASAEYASSVNIIESSTQSTVIQVVGRCRAQSADPEAGEEDRMYIVRYNDHGALKAWQLFNDEESHTNVRPYDLMYDSEAMGTYICGGIDKAAIDNNADLGDCGNEGALFQISGGGCFEEQYCELGQPTFAFKDLVPVLTILNPGVEEVDEFQSISAVIYNLSPVGPDGDCGDRESSEVATKRICPDPPSVKW